MVNDDKKTLNLESEVDMLKGVLDQVGAYIYTKDLNCNYTYANQLVLDLFRVDLNQLIGKHDSEFFDLLRSDEIRKNDLQVLEEGITIEKEEETFIKETGVNILYWSVKKPILNAKGEIIGLCGISTDITERKMLENVIKKQKKLLDIIIDNVDAYIYIKDTDRIFRYANSKVGELFGLSTDEIIGKKDTDFMNSKLADGFWKFEEQVFKTKSRQAIEETLMDAEGMARYCWSVKIPFEFEDDDMTLICFSTDITELHDMKEKLKQQANTDYLTGLYNKRYFNEEANREFSRSIRHQLPLSVIVLDIDHFKKVNDTYGHPIGDQVLNMLSKNLLSLVRAEDIVGRIGGEEFGIILSNTTPEEATVLAERIRSFQESDKMTGDWFGEIKITVSMGISTMRESDELFSDIVTRADIALYEAKQSGRNKFCIE